MSKSAVWLLLAFVLATLAFIAQITIGFWVPITLIILGVVAAVAGVVVDLRARGQVHG